ncbi:MAG: hypothetical protein WCZ10_15135, partial [Desulfobulbaceae bacterium]
RKTSCYPIIVLMDILFDWWGRRDLNPQSLLQQLFSLFLFSTWQADKRLEKAHIAGVDHNMY